MQLKRNFSLYEQLFIEFESQKLQSDKEYGNEKLKKDNK